MNDSDSDDGSGPVELPSGRLICRPHGLVVCGRCCVDYSFMDEVLEDSDDRAEREAEELYNQLSPENRAEIDARWGPPPSSRSNAQASSSSRRPEDVPDPSPFTEIRRGTGQVLPTKFVPPAGSTPNTLFPLGLGLQAIPPVARFIRRDDPEQFLIYTDGACLNNGQANPKAGWACVFRPESTTPQGVFFARLETKGPFGDSHAQTSNRAELRAVIGALRFRHWVGEGFTSLVIATDSEYVVKGATEWARGWLRNGWRTRTGDEVKNKDLWEMLLGEAERWDDGGLKIQFWRIPRELNVDADRAARDVAGSGEAADRGAAVNRSTDAVILWTDGAEQARRSSQILSLVYGLPGAAPKPSTSDAFGSKAASQPTRDVDRGENHGRLSYQPASSTLLDSSFMYPFPTKGTSRQQGIVLTDMPKTFQDAILVTRRLGFRYVWIDSLCIIQDSKDDWLRKAREMGRYYRGASLTVFALDSGGGDEGCFNDRYLPSTSEIEWICPSMSACECLPEGVLDLPRSKAGGWEVLVKKQNRLFKDSRELRLSDAWCNIAEEFSRRNLTYSGDKHPALAGIALEFSATKSGDYVAGLWNDGNLRTHLAWYVPPIVPMQGPSRTSRPSQYRAPSWSWASIDGIFRMALLSYAKVPTTESELRSDAVVCDVLECWIVPRSALNPLGEVSAGAVTLKGRLRRAKVSQEQQSKWFPNRRVIYHEKPDNELGWFNPDDQLSQFPFSDVWCMLLLGSDSRLRGIALVEATTEEKRQAETHGRLENKVFKRVGVVEEKWNERKPGDVAAYRYVIGSDSVDYDRNEGLSTTGALLDWFEAAEEAIISVI
ncbi:RNase H domain [Fusarium albosuccineum]|uniref:RNase H domain n=1 Tax=Fusarium albosuccineum TaxID=1237068 RepID=A0A8H4LDD2_9HYPO|nr:RNase H domain [Fusarium albosuccineum]